MAAITRSREPLRRDASRRAWTIAISLSLALHLALMAWPRWPAWDEIGAAGQDPLRARLMNQQANIASVDHAPEPAAAPAEAAAPPRSSAPPLQRSSAVQRPVAPEPKGRASRAAAAKASGEAATPLPSPPGPSARVGTGESGSAPAAVSRDVASVAAPAVAPPGGARSDIGSIAQYRIALISASRRFTPSGGVEGLEGRVDVQLAIASDGSLADARIARSSGHAALDRLAVDMLRNAKAHAPVPPSLLDRAFEVDVPVVFERPRAP